MWTYEYDESGGYDCITPAVVVKRDGVLMFVIDAKEHGWNNIVGRGSSVEQDRAVVRGYILALALTICNRLND